MTLFKEGDYVKIDPTYRDYAGRVCRIVGLYSGPYGNYSVHVAVLGDDNLLVANFSTVPTSRIARVSPLELLAMQAE